MAISFSPSSTLISVPTGMLAGPASWRPTALSDPASSTRFASAARRQDLVVLAPTVDPPFGSAQGLREEIGEETPGHEGAKAK